MEAVSESIRCALHGAGLRQLDDAMLSKCTVLATTLQLTPKQLADCWEALALNRHYTTLDDRAWAQFRQQLVKESEVDDIMVDSNTNSNTPVGLVAHHRLPNVTPPAKRANQHWHVADGDVVMSSSNHQRRVSVSPNSHAAATSHNNKPKYAEREQAGQVVVTYCPNQKNLPTTDHNSSKTKRCHIAWQQFSTNVPASYRHMFTPLTACSKALNAQLETMSAALQLHLDADNHDMTLEGVGVPRQDMITCVGRICNAAHEGRINASSVLLEGDVATAGGARMAVDLSHLQATKTPYSLFPGQVVAIQGMNVSGRKLVAYQIWEGVMPSPCAPAPPPPSTTVEATSPSDGPVRVLTACGPFTTSDNLDYAPLTDLLTTIMQDQPDVVLLLGPFVDVRHNAVAAGQTNLEFDNGEQVAVPFETFFANKIALMLEDLYIQEETLETQFVLVPSLEDAAGTDAVYPQPPFYDRLAKPRELKVPGGEGLVLGTLGLDQVELAGRDDAPPSASLWPRRRVHCVPNPCTLHINNVTVGVTSTDVLFHLSADETSAHLEPGSRLGRIAAHLLQQRSYYPLFPANVNADYKFAAQMSMPVAPDLLILPSKLSGFCRTIGGGGGGAHTNNGEHKTVVLNPGHLVRDTTGGTYAVAELYPSSSLPNDQAGVGLDQRTRIEIKRI